MELCYSCQSLVKSAFLSKYSLLDNLSSQSKERCYAEAQRPVAYLTLTGDFTFDIPSIETSKF